VKIDVWPKPHYVACDSGVPNQPYRASACGCSSLVVAQIDKEKVLESGDTAVVFGSMITTGDPTVLRCAMVYRKRAGAWKMIAAHLVPVSETKDARGQ
jgi:ketosteroid isomerase-like protein